MIRYIINTIWNLLYQKQIQNLLSIFILSIIFINNIAANPDRLFKNQTQLHATQFINAVLARNPSIKSSVAEWQLALNRIEQVSALDDPMLNYSFAPETQNLAAQDFGQKIQISQKLPWPGKRQLRENSARYAAIANEKNIEFRRLQLSEISMRLFAEWYYIHRAIDINNENRKLWREFQAIAKVKYTAGRVSKQDVIRADVEQAMLQHQSILLQTNQRNIQSQLNTFLNQIPDTLIPPPSNLGPVNSLPNIIQLRAMAIDNDPKLKILLARRLASQSEVKLAQKNYYPDFTINAAYNSLWAQEQKRFTIGFGMNIPFGQSKRDAALDEKNAQSLQLKWKIIDLKANIHNTVQRSYNNIEESRHVLNLYQDTLLPLAEENLHSSKADYQSGKGNFLDLVGAEKNLIQTQLSQVRAQADYQQHLATLARSVGKLELLNLNITINHSNTKSSVGVSK